MQRLRRPSPIAALVLALSVLANLAGADTAAYAADPIVGDAAEAKRHYEEGTKAFNLGEFSRAVTEFKATYNLKPDPLLLYNIAQSYRLGGDPGQALFFYRSFLRNMPDATNRKEVEARIRTLEKLTSEQKREPNGAALPHGPGAAAATPTAPPATSEPSPTSAHREATTGSRSAAGAGSSQSASAASRSAAPTQAGPPAIAAGSTMPPPQLDITAQDVSQPTEPASSPVYKRWWFWPAVGTASLIVLIGLASAARRPPSTTLGIYDPDNWQPVP